MQRIFDSCHTQGVSFFLQLVGRKRMRNLLKSNRICKNCDYLINKKNIKKEARHESTCYKQI